ncbi:MAG: zinc-dependent peptidase [Planctomycetes bacterium]|nr:zinc-dependent peptidase [Planctomycetota bacterium]
MFEWLKPKPGKHTLSSAQFAAIKRLPWFAMLPTPIREGWIGRVAEFLASRNIEGCNGLVVTPEMRVAVAAQACLLVAARSSPMYPRMSSVLLYPHAYVTRHMSVNEIGIEAQVQDVNLGESWDRGNVVLSWEDVELDALNPDDGFNVTIHEFAHQLDSENGAMDGAPELPKAMRARWAEVMNTEYEALCKFADSLPEEPEDSQAEPDPAFDERRERHEGDWVLDPYGAQDPAEFFAVATEAFFEDARRLRGAHPRVYELLAGFYGQHPADWPGWNNLLNQKAV